jgi:hypothetical protein
MRHYNVNGAHHEDRVGPRYAGAAATPDNVGRHRASPPAALRRVPRLLALVVFIWALGCVGWVAATRLNRPPQPTSTAAEQSVDDQATAWIKANLTADTRLLTDRAIPPEGYPATSVATAGDWQDYDYLITSATVPGPDAVAATVWRSSIAVAVFDGVQVRRILPSADLVLQTRDADRADRLVAGTALLGNPRVEAAPDTKSVLAAGGLDLRAATALSALAGAGPVRLDKISVVAAEAAAGVPARSITVRTSDFSLATRVLSGLTAAFRPDQVIRESDGAIRLHWPLNFDPVPTLH